MSKKILSVGLCIFLISVSSGCVEKVEITYPVSNDSVKEAEPETKTAVKIQETDLQEETMSVQTESAEVQKSIREWFDEYSEEENAEAKDVILDFFCNNTREFLRELSLYEMKEPILYLVQWESAVAILEDDQRYRNIMQSAAKLNLSDLEREILQALENGALGLAEANGAGEPEREYSAGEVIQLFHDYNEVPSEELLKEMLNVFEAEPVLFLDSLLCMDYQEQILQAVSWEIYHTGRDGDNRYHDVLEHLHQEKIHTGTSEMLDILEQNIDGVKRHEGEH